MRLIDIVELEALKNQEYGKGWDKGYQQGRKDIIQGINNIFNKYTDIIVTAPTRLVMCETKAMCLDDVMEYLLNQLEKEQKNG